MSTEYTSVLMRESAKPYSGFMIVDGKTVRCSLTPGVHVLPVNKVAQLCRDFPDVFTAEVPHSDPQSPGSSEQSTSAAPASSTESSTPKGSTKAGKGKRG